METARNEQRDLVSMYGTNLFCFLCYVMKMRNAYQQSAFKHMLRPEMLTLYIHKLTVYYFKAANNG